MNDPTMSCEQLFRPIGCASPRKSGTTTKSTNVIGGSGEIVCGTATKTPSPHTYSRSHVKGY